MHKLKAIKPSYLLRDNEEATSKAQPWEQLLSESHALSLSPA